MAYRPSPEDLNWLASQQQHMRNIFTRHGIDPNNIDDALQDLLYLYTLRGTPHPYINRDVLFKRARAYVAYVIRRNWQRAHALGAAYKSTSVTTSRDLEAEDDNLFQRLTKENDPTDRPGGLSEIPYIRARLQGFDLKVFNTLTAKTTCFQQSKFSGKTGSKHRNLESIINTIAKAKGRTHDEVRAAIERIRLQAQIVRDTYDPRPGTAEPPEAPTNARADKLRRLIQSQLGSRYGLDAAIRRVHIQTGASIDEIRDALSKGAA